MNIADYDAAALFHLPKRKELNPDTGLDVSLDIYGRRELIEAVRALGVDFHVTRGKDAYDSHGSIEVFSPVISLGSFTTATALGVRDLADYGVIRSISGSLEHVTSISLLTDPAVRELASDKFIASTLLAELGLHEGASLVTSSASLRQAMEQTDGDNIVLKPRRGSRSQGIIVVNKSTAGSLFSQRDNKDMEYILEQKLNFMVPFPNSIKGRDQDNQIRLDEANRDGVNKEVRVMYFGDGSYSYIARVAKKNETDFRTDDWLYLDETTIPDEITSIGQKVVDAIGEKTGITEFHIAIDLTYATTDNNTQAKWRVMEINANEPQLVQLKQHREVGLQHASLMAVQIARVARKRSVII